MTFIFSSPVFYIYLGLKLLAAFLILFVRLFISNWLHDDNMIDDITLMMTAFSSQTGLQAARRKDLGKSAANCEKLRGNCALS